MAAPPIDEKERINVTRLQATCSNGSVYVGYCFGTPTLSKRGAEKIKMLTKECEFKPYHDETDHGVKNAWRSYHAKKICWDILRPAKLKKVNENEETLEDIQRAEAELNNQEAAELNRMQLLITQE